MRKYLCFFICIIYFSHWNFAQNNNAAHKENTQLDSLKRYPEFDSLRFFVCFKKEVNYSLVYNSQSGFSNNKAKKLLGALVRKQNIIEISQAFKHLNKYPFNNIYVVKIKEASESNRLLALFKEMPDIVYSEHIPLYHSFIIPNDLCTQQSAYMTLINAPSAWDLAVGSPNIRIAIIDDAVRITHEDLDGSCWTNPIEIPNNGIDEDSNGYIDDYHGFDVSDNDFNVNPPPWATNSDFTHGTHVCGIAAVGTNNTTGIAGVSNGCSYIPVKTRPDSLSGNALPDAYLGLEYAIVIHADVINMSWGGFLYSQTYQLLCDSAHNAGIVLVAAAGNTGTNDSIFPSCYNHVISVGSTNLNDVVSTFSTYGVCLDVMAPGVSIYSTLAGNDTAYDYMSGTSMAAPIVSGICGIMLSHNPSMTPDEVEQCLEFGSLNINLQNPLRVGMIGAGRVDALGALTCAEAPPHPCIDVLPYGLYVCPGGSATFNGSSLGLSATSWYWTFPGGIPANSTLPNPTVTYNIPGNYDIIVVACNSFGCDTITYHNYVYVAQPQATMSAFYTGTVCLGSASYLNINFIGNPPFSFSYTDGIMNDTVHNIFSYVYQIPVFPTTNTTYMITGMTDAYCTGVVSGTVTLNPIECTPCSNTDFEFGNFSTWIGMLGKCCGLGNFSYGIIPTRQLITSGSDFDPYSLNMIPVVCPDGGLYSARLGNYYVGGEAERLEKTFLVTPDNSSLTYHFAIIMEDPIGHTPNDKPKFEVRIMDMNNNLLPDTCAYYQVTAGLETDNWFHNNTVRYHPWTAVTIDLSSYIGDMLKIQFTTEDCGLLGHFGYSYIDLSCSPSAIEVMGFCDTIDTISLSAPNGYISYLWHPSGDTTQNISIIGPSNGDTISVTMQNAAGCINTLSKVLVLLPKPIPISSPDVYICAQDTAMLWIAGAGPGGTYSWTSSPPGFVSDEDTVWVHPDHTTSYYAHVVNSNGCPADSVPEINVFVNDALAFDLGVNQVVCKYDSIEIVYPGNADSIMWHSYPPGFTSTEDTIIVSPTSTTIYYLTAFENGCDYTDNIAVSIYNYYNDEPITHIPFCSQTGSVTLDAPAGNFNYFWPQTFATSSQIVITNPVAYAMYYVTFNSPNGCADTMHFILVPIPDPIAFAGNDTSVCKGFSVMIHGSGSDAPSPEYSWTSIPAGFTSNSQDIIVNPNATTKYVLTVTNGLNCPSPPSTDTITVFVNISPEFEMGTDQSICLGDSIIMTISAPNGFNYWFSDPPGFQSTDSTVVLKPSQETIYYLTINTSICTFTDYFTVHINHGYNDTITTEYCSFDSVIFLHAPILYASYFWPDFGDTSSEITIQLPINDTIIRLVAQDSASACHDSIFFKLVKKVSDYLLEINPSDTIVCSGNQIALQVEGDSSVFLAWYSDPPGLNVTGSDSLVVLPVDTVTYFCISNQNGCYKKDSVKIWLIKTPEFSLPDSLNLCIGDSVFVNTEVLAQHFLWSDGVIDSARFFTMPGSYVLFADNLGCQWNDTIKINFSDDPGLIIPNVFTPNGDMLNDYFNIIVEQSTFYHLEIFNRWGDKVFVSDNPKIVWDGTYNHTKLAEGVYFYIFTYNSVCQQKITTLNGTIHLLR